MKPFLAHTPLLTGLRRYSLGALALAKYLPLKSYNQIPTSSVKSTTLYVKPSLFIRQLSYSSHIYQPQTNINLNANVIKKTEPLKIDANLKDSLVKQRTPVVTQVSFLNKIKANIKWLLIRNKERPFSKDEIGTIFSWLILSQIVWLILKTTTVVSLLLLTFNTVFAKELVAQTIGNLINYLSDDITIKFQDALIPEWKNGFIKFKNVELNTNENQKSNILEFHLMFHEIEMNLSLRKWIQGNGLINDIKVFGIRGETIINYKSDKSDNILQEFLLSWFSNPNYRLNNVNITDSKFRVLENFGGDNESTSFKIRIFNLDISGLRFNQLLTDFLKANVVTGSINNSLFSFHKRQHKLSYMKNLESDLSSWEKITRLRLNSINVNDLGLNKTSAFSWIEDGNVEITADIMLPHDQDDEKLHNVVRDKDNEKYVLLDLKFKFKDLKASLPNKTPTLSTGEQIISLEELKPVVSFVNLQRILSRSNNNNNNNEFNDIVDNGNENSHHLNYSTPNVSIKRRKSYPNITVIQSDKKSKDMNNNGDSENESKNGTSIIRFHPTDNGSQSSNSYSSQYDPSISYNNRNEISLHCRIVKNVKDLENMILFQETGVYDQVSMELYVDLIKIVEEWEFKNKDEWMKDWGTSFASQLLLFGFTNSI